jgi:hypothetical protein
MNPANFWILPCKVIPFSWVIYREDGEEILVEIRHKNIIYKSQEITALEAAWFKKKCITNQLT